jgi:hypothetical protein
LPTLPSLLEKNTLQINILVFFLYLDTKRPYIGEELILENEMLALEEKWNTSIFCPIMCHPNYTTKTWPGFFLKTI